MRHIIVPVDLGDFSQRIINYAADFVGDQNIKLHLIHIIPLDVSYVIGDMGMQYIQSAEDTAIASDKAKLRAMTERLDEKGIVYSIKVEQGIPADIIIEQAEKHNAEMIIMGSHGRGLLYETFVGSVTKDVLQETDIPVLIIPDKFRKD